MDQVRLVDRKLVWAVDRVVGWVWVVGMGVVLVLKGVVVGRVGSLVGVKGMAQRVFRICILLLVVNRNFLQVVLQHGLLQ